MSRRAVAALAVALLPGCRDLIPVDGNADSTTGEPAGWPSTAGASSAGGSNPDASDDPDPTAASPDPDSTSAATEGASTDGSTTSPGSSSSAGLPELPDDFVCEAAAPIADRPCEDDLSPDGVVSSTVRCGPMSAHADVYAFEATAGDCIYIAADNVDVVAGATGSAAGDIFVYLQSPGGAGVVLDDTDDCTDPVWNDFGCVLSGETAAATGTHFLAIGQHGGDGCPDPSPYALGVSVNGVDVVLRAVGIDVICE